MTTDAVEGTDIPMTVTTQTAWEAAEAGAAALVRARTGSSLGEHLMAKLIVAPGMRMLALGANAAALAVEVASHATGVEVVCVEAGEEALQASRQRALALGVDAQFVVADLDTLVLERAAFDLAFSHAMLHRVTAMVPLAEGIKQALRHDGMFIAVEVVARDDYFMWPATRAVARDIWKTLPVKFRLNHTGYAVPLIDDEIWEPQGTPDETSIGRGENILPVLEQLFVTEHFVPYFGLCRRFFDSMYGPNYDLAEPLDRALFDWIWHLDVHHLATGRLRPESIFAIYRPG